MTEMLEHIDTNHGIPTLLASIVVIIGLHLIFRVLEFVWDIVKKKQEASEESVKANTNAVSENTKALARLESRLEKTETAISSLPKIRTDMNRAFMAIKMVAGETWPEIRKAMLDDFDV